MANQKHPEESIAKPMVVIAALARRFFLGEPANGSPYRQLLVRWLEHIFQQYALLIWLVAEEVILAGGHAIKIDEDLLRHSEVGFEGPCIFVRVEGTRTAHCLHLRRLEAVQHDATGPGQHALGSVEATLEGIP